MRQIQYCAGVLYGLLVLPTLAELVVNTIRGCYEAFIRALLQPAKCERPSRYQAFVCQHGGAFLEFTSNAVCGLSVGQIHKIDIMRAKGFFAEVLGRFWQCIGSQSTWQNS